jgi:hypothetical protein
VTPRTPAGGPGTLLAVAAADWGADVAFTLADAAKLSCFVPKIRDLDLLNGNTDEIFALFPDQFTGGDELPELFLDNASDNLPKPVQVLFNTLHHG